MRMAKGAGRLDARLDWLWNTGRTVMAFLMMLSGLASAHTNKTK